MLYWDGSLVIFNPDHRIVNGGPIVFTSCIIAILTISMAIIQSCKGTSGWFSKGTKLSSIFNYYQFGEDQIVNGASIVFTGSIVEILTTSRAIIQPCMGGSGCLAKGTKLSSIFNYYLSLVKIE